MVAKGDFRPMQCDASRLCTARTGLTFDRVLVVLPPALAADIGSVIVSLPPREVLDLEVLLAEWEGLFKKINATKLRIQHQQQKVTKHR